VNLFFNPRARRQLLSEIAAQFDAFRATGLALDHVNAHKHFHLHPVIGRMIVAIGRSFGLSAVRVPWEPRDVIGQAEPGARPESLWTVAPWARLLRWRLHRAGIKAPDYVFGLRWSGVMTEDRLLRLIRHVPHGLSEIYCHPATGAFAGAAVDYRYGEELAALVSPDVVAAARDPSLRLGGFSDFLKAEDNGRPACKSRQTEPDRRVRQ
jgi:hopanoid biosynthesis associated protein HpnK